MRTSTRILALFALLSSFALAPASFAQTLLTEDFTGATSSATNGQGNWLFFNGACLTAGTNTNLVAPASSIPACTAVLKSYYNLTQDGDRYLVGGANGYLGGTAAPASVSAQIADPVGQGALRFTNGKPYGNQQRGAIVSTNAYNTSAGIQVTFKTTTYDGTGADGISFYLMDGCVPVTGGVIPSGCTPTKIYPTGSPTVPAIGGTGGSLAYSCSNMNGPLNGGGVTYDGLTGGYLGLGIDEYGNFLNQGDNTASGYGFKAGRIGLRGAGAISWPALNNAYGTNPNDLTKPYYPATMSLVCAVGALDGSSNTCGVCPSIPSTSVTVGGVKTTTVTTTVYANSVCTNTAVATAKTGNTIISTSTTVTTTGPLSAIPAVVNNTAIEAAVQLACVTGHLYNYAVLGVPADAGPATLANTGNTAGILDYPAIPSAYTVLPSSNPLYNGGAATRAAATTIFYNLKITNDGFLSLSYAYNGGAYQSVIANQNIQASNGPLPNFVRFGFAGSTGGSTNVHEILCFKSAPVVQSGSSAGVNDKQSATVESGTFAYFAYYDPNNWVGRVTASALTTDANGVVSLAATPSWDASCVLTGVIAGQTCSTGIAGPTAGMTPASRTILTYNNGGTAFEWGNLSSAQQTALDTGDPTSTQYRFNYLRGDRSNEINTAGTCTGGSSVCFRARTSILGDVVDSSPTWVGPPEQSYTATWQDKLYPGASMGENSGTSYSQYTTNQQTRPNVVYVGSNDGMMHGFRSGSNDSAGNFTTATTPNDGQEVLAYVPGSLLLSASTGGACASLSQTGSVVQNIHGVTPASGIVPACVSPALDFSGIQYGHNFFVDATPGTGDLYYNNAWHTWLVSGLGAGGAAIFALDVTNPTAANFTEGNASTIVQGEWTASTISCATDSGSVSCGRSLGATFGTPIIRRLHDGRWAAIFGNGYGSATGDAGIFVMTVSSSGGKQFYYLSTGNAGNIGASKGNGIAYVSSADLDGDHITDYVYAGDLLGNLWRFDLTSATESAWTVSPGPLFTAPGGQPITSSVTVSAGATTAGANTLVITFGTGMRTQFTNAAAVSYKSAAQTIYGIWDWNMNSWNSKSTVTYATQTNTATSMTGPSYTLSQSKLQQQTFTLNADGSTRDINNPTAICWAGTPGCAGAAGKYGWYVNLIGSLEQIIYNPIQVDGVFIVNSVVPANNQVTACTTNTDQGFTYALSILTGAPPTNFFIGYNDASAGGVQTNAVGSMFGVTGSTGNYYMVYQTVSGSPNTMPGNLPINGKGKRLTWVELR